MRISTYTLIAFQLNGALGSGKYDHLTIELIKKEIENYTIFTFLEESIKYFDTSIISTDDKNKLIEQWQDIMYADIDHKLCIEKNGLSLLIGYILECIQREESMQRKELNDKIMKLEKELDAKNGIIRM